MDCLGSWIWDSATTVIPRLVCVKACVRASGVVWNILSLMSLSFSVVATELAKALNCSVNDLPLSLALSHLEQKAAAVLLTLLSLGVKNIRLGPSLPAYVSPGVLDVLIKEYNIMGTNDYRKDLESMMQGQ